MKLLALATASTLFLAGCGDDATEVTPQDHPRSNHKTFVQPTKQNTKSAKEKAEELTAKGLRKGAHGAGALEEKMEDAADYMSSDGE